MGAHPGTSQQQPVFRMCKIQIPAWAAAAPVWPLLLLAPSTVLSASPVQQQQYFWACQGLRNHHRCLCSDFACCLSHLPPTPRWATVSPVSLGWERGRGCSVPVSRAVSRGMLVCREVWKRGRLRRQPGGGMLSFRDKQGTSSLHQ